MALSFVAGPGGTTQVAAVDMPTHFQNLKHFASLATRRKRHEGIIGAD
jgi:hypothetical protein